MEKSLKLLLALGIVFPGCERNREEESLFDARSELKLEYCLSNRIQEREVDHLVSRLKGAGKFFRFENICSGKGVESVLSRLQGKNNGLGYKVLLVSERKLPTDSRSFRQAAWLRSDRLLSAPQVQWSRALKLDLPQPVSPAFRGGICEKGLEIFTESKMVCSSFLRADALKKDFKEESVKLSDGFVVSSGLGLPVDVGWNRLALIWHEPVYWYVFPASAEAKQALLPQLIIIEDELTQAAKGLLERRLKLSAK